MKTLLKYALLTLARITVGEAFFLVLVFALAIGIVGVTLVLSLLVEFVFAVAQSLF